MCEKCKNNGNLGVKELKTFKDVSWYKNFVAMILKYTEQVYQDGEKKLFLREDNLVRVFQRFGMDPDNHIENLKKFRFFEDKTDDPIGYYIYPEGHPLLNKNFLTAKQMSRIAQKLIKTCQIFENAKTKERWECLSANEVEEFIKEMGYRPMIVIGQLLDKHYLVPTNTLPIKPNAYLIFRTQKEGKEYCEKNGRF